MWWITYRGEGKTGVENIGVFEDDGTPRKDHPLLLDQSLDAHPLHIALGFALVGDDLYKRDPFEQSVGDDTKTALGYGGALGSPGNAYIYNWNMLPIGQLLWEKELLSYKQFPPLQAPETTWTAS